MTRSGGDAAPGAERGLTLRPLTLGDFDAYFAMKCDPDDVRMAGFAGPPDKSGQRRWLERELENADASLLVAVMEDGAGIAGYLFVRLVALRPDAPRRKSVTASPRRSAAGTTARR
jgi:hypothetical protein